MQGHHGPWDLSVRNMVKDHKAMLDYKLCLSERRSSKEKDFKYFYVFL